MTHCQETWFWLCSFAIWNHYGLRVSIQLTLIDNDIKYNSFSCQRKLLLTNLIIIKESIHHFLNIIISSSYIFVMYGRSYPIRNLNHPNHQFQPIEPSWSPSGSIEFRGLSMTDLSRSLSTGTRVRTRPLFAFSSKLSKYPNIFKRFFLTFFDTTRGKERMWNGFEKFVSTGSVSRDKFHYSFFLCWIVWWSKSSDLNERSLFIVNISQHFFIHTYIVS